MNAPTTEKHIHRVVQKLGAKIQSLQKVNERIKSNTDAMAKLNSKELPEHAKPFAVNFETPLLDAVFIPEETVFQPAIPAGKTVREAKEMAYMQYLLVQRQLDKITLDRQRWQIRETTTQEAFIDQCLAVPKVES